MTDHYFMYYEESKNYQNNDTLLLHPDLRDIKMEEVLLKIVEL